MRRLITELNAMRSIPYQNLVGSLNHLAVMTRPDIAKAVQTVSQFSSNPGMKHWNATLRIVKYLCTTKTGYSHLAESWNPRFRDSSHTQMWITPTMLTMVDPFLGMPYSISHEMALVVCTLGALRNKHPPHSRPMNRSTSQVSIRATKLSGSVSFIPN